MRCFFLDVVGIMIVFVGMTCSLMFLNIELSPVCLVSMAPQASVGVVVQKFKQQRLF